MSEHARTVLRDLGLAIHVPGVMALVTIPLCLLLAEPFAIPPFLATAALALALGQGLYRAHREASAMQVRHAMDTAALAWLVVPLIGALPFLLVALSADPARATPTLLHFRDPWNALFEATSGFTSTGLTVTLHPSDLPRSLIWWRSLMQWVGGVGVIVLLLAVLHPSRDAERLYLAEARDQAIRPRLIETVRTIWWIYLLYTIVGVLALGASGMPWWHALNYGMAATATGGFGSTDGNLGDFGAASQVVIMALILLGAISFATHDRILRERRPSLLWRGGESRLLLGLGLSGALILVLENRHALGSWTVLDSTVQWLSALSTAGFQSADIGAWSITAHLLLTAAMIGGGAAGSSAGGLKLRRVGLLAGGALDRVARIARQPWRLTEHKTIGDPHEAKRSLEAAAVLLALWLTTLLGGTLALLQIVAPGVPLEQVLLEATSALGNVGLSAGLTGPDLPWPGKLSLMVLMWVGRLEIVPAIVLFAALLPRR